MMFLVTLSIHLYIFKPLFLRKFHNVIAVMANSYLFKAPWLFFFDISLQYTATEFLKTKSSTTCCVAIILDWISVFINKQNDNICRLKVYRAVEILWQKQRRHEKHLNWAFCLHNSRLFIDIHLFEKFIYYKNKPGAEEENELKSAKSEMWNRR